jgi:hypothetical protein
MKLPILVSAAALMLAGAALAQPGREPVRIASDFEGATSAPMAHGAQPLETLRPVQQVSSQLRLACAADRERLCADSKGTLGAGRCLKSHRRDVTEPCRAALTRAAMAWTSPREVSAPGGPPG